MTYFNQEQNHQLNTVRVALRALCLRECEQGVLPPQIRWPSTRDVAKCCDISIYIARYYLIKLVERKKAYVAPCSVKNSLRWCSTEFIVSVEEHSLPPQE
ncbi:MULTISPECIES: FaeA/PapI family transcriptional regulator [unclassified Serratia (in: enterobacteria)]|uniref:FaeA/PapI family transcriptional regulator n=1 Tax=unclassified Serratia (in: enterobacteria) TaxID=2647522 RepID=UPI003FA69A05